MPVEIVTSIIGVPIVREPVPSRISVSVSKGTPDKLLVNLSSRRVQQTGDSFLVLDQEKGDLTGANFIGTEINKAGIRIYDQETVLPGITKRIRFR